ncbi:MAG: TIGR00341 family protein [Gammaproteobacteria bacterium]|nr:MAG: TIGR00341 family protein [Gammaproteobacteria bacterium]
MKYVEVVADLGHVDTVSAIAEQLELYDFRLGSLSEDGLQQMRMLVPDNKIQNTLDKLQQSLETQPNERIVVLPIEISLPKLSDDERRDEDLATASREMLYKGVEKNSHLDTGFVLLVVLSTIVAAVGLIKDNVAVIIGAMVIAPLLGPNLALGLGTALGDISLVVKSIFTTLVGIAIAVSMSIVIGFVWPTDTFSPELIARTEVGLDSVALALASGAAAALSLTTGLSSVLVGVMVAVALLPPAATVGIMLGYGNINLAMGAVLLLAINIACVNLACNVVFLIKGISPRTWWKKEKAKKSMRTYVIMWIGTLLILMLIIYLRQSLNT